MNILQKDRANHIYIKYCTLEIYHMNQSINYFQIKIIQ